MFLKSDLLDLTPLKIERYAQSALPSPVDN